CGVAIAPGESCCSGKATTSVRVPRWVSARALKRSAIADQVSQSVRDSHGLEIAGLKEGTKGCTWVVGRSCFSYQVEAGSTTSECRVWLVMRKSRVSIRSTLPIGASSRQRTSSGRRCSGVSSAVTELSTPSRWRKKYWTPFAEEPRVLARQIDQI